MRVSSSCNREDQAYSTPKLDTRVARMDRGWPGVAFICLDGGQRQVM